MADNGRKPKLPVHLILGVSDYMRINTSERPRVGQIGDPAKKTRFDWTIIAQGKEIDYTSLLLTQTRLPWKGAHPHLPTNLNGSLRRLTNQQR